MRFKAVIRFNLNSRLFWYAPKNYITDNNNKSKLMTTTNIVS